MQKASCLKGIRVGSWGYSARARAKTANLDSLYKPNKLVVLRMEDPELRYTKHGYRKSVWTQHSSCERQ